MDHETKKVKDQCYIRQANCVGNSIPIKKKSTKVKTEILLISSQNKNSTKNRNPPPIHFHSKQRRKQTT